MNLESLVPKEYVYHKTHNGILLKGDCIEVMKQMQNSLFDLIIADYPFNSQDGRKDYIQFVKETTIEFDRLSKPISNLVVINNPHNIFKTSKFYQSWILVNEIALIRKGALRPAWHFGFQHNTCLILNKGGIKNKWNGPTKNHDKSFYTDVLEYQNTYRSGSDFHPQAIPEWLVKILIETLSDVDDIILDPFSGSGTIPKVAEETGRRWIAIELKDAYCDMIVRRLENE